MSVLGTIQNIKIPYAEEGVVRTAQIDDTIAPSNSVQLAVNMNFDRVGAIQTRPGVTEYVDDLAEAIKNFGTLRNSISTIEYSVLEQLGITVDTEENFASIVGVKVSNTKIAVFWAGASNHGKARLYEVSQFTGTIEAIGSVIEFDATNAASISAVLMDDETVMTVWTGSGALGYAQAFDVSGNTISAYGTPYNFDAVHADNMSLGHHSTTQAILFYVSSSSDGKAITLFMNSVSKDVTSTSTPLTFDSGSVGTNSCCPLEDAGGRWLNFWTDSGGKVQCFQISGANVVALDSVFAFGTSGTHCSAMTVGDGTHVVASFTGDTGHLVAQCFSVNPSTFAVTATTTAGVIKLGGGSAMKSVGFGDGYHFTAFYATSAGIGFAQMFELDPSTFAVSVAGTALSGYSFGADADIAPIDLSLSTIICLWNGYGTVQGHGAMFQTLSDVTDGRFLYAAHGDEVSNTTGGAWTVRRTGLAEVSKPRFSQYLNRIWMVNGNQQLGGDPVATSDGGGFDQTLVPIGFPKGDFISAGFEGRIWVANKTLGIIFYTDIVQFTEDGTYEISYNSSVNFISTISPQDGETMTALVQVPRALLVFTENTITRIYGASSLDAYPAYNVGTFSQESIVTTKTGIFFHHSSGFYQFDYGSQPVEISRRIIDFVKAIPRDNYEDISGVYDGFDNVEWSVGQVTVEGVVFVNCVLRYTISTQVWTVYDYGTEIGINAMIFYDDGEDLNHLIGTSTGKTGALDTGETDFGNPFYYEFIDRWRSYTEMYYQAKDISGVNVYSENAAGANLMYQIQKSGPNAWKQLGTVNENNSSLMPNAKTEDFDVMRFRLAGTTKGAQVIVHGLEVAQLTIKGQESN